MSLNCLDVRRILGAEPGRREALLRSHLAECPGCAEFAAEMERLNVRLKQAMSLPVPERLAPRIVLDATLKHGGRLRGWFAAAAGIVLAVSVGAGVWQGLQAPPLGRAIVEHIDHEPMSLLKTDDRVRPSLIKAILARTGASVQGKISDVSYARLCYFKGRLVAHLVIEKNGKPITVLLLPHIHVKQATPINEDGFHGTIEPLGAGSIAVVGNQDASLQPVAQEMLRMMHWRA